MSNSQATVLAPTGTICFLMDCDTTGIEPDLGLVKTKKLVGGGTMSIVNQTVPRALRRLGYGDDQIVEIVAYIDEHKSISGPRTCGQSTFPSSPARWVTTSSTTRPREDDGGGTAFHLRRDLEVREHAR